MYTMKDAAHVFCYTIVMMQSAPEDVLRVYRDKILAFSKQIEVDFGLKSGQMPPNDAVLTPEAVAILREIDGVVGLHLAQI